MPGKFNPSLYNYLLTQKSINEAMPYDVIEEIILDSINYVKNQNINARISNVVFNIKGRLVFAQVYIERKNGFAPTKDNKFGTTPTAYNVQVRFPFGLETSLGQERVFLPRGDFIKPLQPYKSPNGKISDDVERDINPATLICGPGVKKEISPDRAQVRLSIPNGEALTLELSKEIGKGFESIQGLIEYYVVSDFDLRLKKAELYPLLYSSSTESKGESKETLVHQRLDYHGYTEHQYGEYEPKNDGLTQERKQDYQAFITAFNQQITSTPVGQRLIGAPTQSLEDGFVLDISILNGIHLFTQSGRPVTRLRDYQLELFRNCEAFIENLRSNREAPRSGKINMGVGAGKTFFTFTLLQHLKHTMPAKGQAARILPSFCMAPDEEVAKVTKRSIDRQGTTSGISAVSITKPQQMPNTEFLSQYQTLSTYALKAARKIDAYINNGLHTDENGQQIKIGIQVEILKFFNATSLHPLSIINFMYAKSSYPLREVAKFKDSIDLKRLVLLVEGQKMIISKTGMLGIEGLGNLLEQFTAIRQGMQNDHFFTISEAKPSTRKPLHISYNKSVDLRSGGQINICELTSPRLSSILDNRCGNNLRAKREALMRMACLASTEAAVLLANSGGLGNTYTDAELRAQIDSFLEIAVTQLTTLAKKAATYQEHYTIFLYLKEMLVTPPPAIDLDIHLRQQKIHDFHTCLYDEALTQHIQLIEHIETHIAATIKSLGTVGEIKELSESKASLNQWGIQPGDNPIKAANQLAGIASLGLTGHTADDDANLLLSHVPVFTPEGLACYFEHLASLEGQPQLHFEQQFGIYAVSAKKRAVVSKKEIKERLLQILNAIMIADEVHKESFSFLYDTRNPVYRRINVITQRYLNQEFIKVLPPRIGMSGTINQVSDQAFGETTLYNFSTQKMIRQGLVKQVSIDTQPAIIPEQKEKSKQAYAKRLVVDYFVQNTHLSLENVPTGKNYAIDLFRVSKGLIFSKIPDEELNRYITDYFKLLIQENPQGDKAQTGAFQFYR